MSEFQGQSSIVAANTSDLSITTTADVVFRVFSGDAQLMMDLQCLMDKSLSEPYSIFTYKYFLEGWPNLAFVATVGSRLIGGVVSKVEEANNNNQKKGYIAMLAVEEEYRKRQIGKLLVLLSMREMARCGCDEIYLETEASNQPALNLYDKLGFARDELLRRYYLNGGDAFRLRFFVDSSVIPKIEK